MPLKKPDLNASVPSVRVFSVEEPTLSPEMLPALLREINDRQWGALLEVLFEAKYKAEAMLRNDSVYESPGKVAHYQGWVTYADYVIGSLETLRASRDEPAGAPEPGPE